MKKQIASALVGIVAYIGGGQTGIAQNIKAPEYKIEQFQGSAEWWNKERTKFGQVNYYDRNKDGITDLSEALVTCDGIPMKHPFGIFDFNTGKLYLDKNIDGVIDEVAPYVNRAIADDAPDCH